MSPPLIPPLTFFPWFWKKHHSSFRQSIAFGKVKQLCKQKEIPYPNWTRLQRTGSRSGPIRKALQGRCGMSRSCWNCWLTSGRHRTQSGEPTPRARSDPRRISSTLQRNSTKIRQHLRQDFYLCIAPLPSILSKWFTAQWNRPHRSQLMRRMGPVGSKPR